MDTRERSIDLLMNFLAAIWNEFVLGGHLDALGSPSIAATAAILMGRIPTIPLLVMAYLFSYGAYMLNRGSEVSQDLISSPERTTYLSSRSGHLTLISATCFGLGYLIAIFSGLLFFVVLLVPLLLALIYTVGSKNLIGLIGARRLKEKLLVKNATISFGFSLIPILVGLYYQSVPIILLTFSPFIFLRILSNSVFFDLRDVKADAEFGVRTVPVVFGADRSYQLMSVIDLLSALYLVGLVYVHSFPLYSLSLMVFPVYSVVYRWFSKRPKVNLEFLCNVVADGEFDLWVVLMVIGSLVV